MNSSETENNDTFLVMWDNTGLECIFNLTDAKKEYDEWHSIVMWEKLQGRTVHLPPPGDPPLKQMILRAKFNTQRHYEIYTFNATGLDKKDIKDMFESNPQYIVDWIREHGEKIYSDRANTKTVVIV